MAADKPAPKSSDKDGDEDDLCEAKEAYDAASDAWSRNYDLALEDFRFARLGEQWPEVIRRQRMADARPCLTINRLPSFIRQVVNDARQNKPSINVHPVDSAADPETAEIYNGLIRHIEQSSDADVAYDTALEHAVTGGFGWFGINTRYSTDDGFEQDIVIEPKMNPFSVLGDPASTGADSSDWNVAFELAAMTAEAFEARWDGADPVSFDGKGVSKTPAGEGETVQVSAWWTRERTMRQIVAVSDPDPAAPDEVRAQAMGLMGERMILDLKVYEANKDLFDALGVRIVGQPRAVPSFKVSQRIISGADVLETNAWAGKFIPIVAVYGEDLNIEGRRYLSGLVRSAQDPQRMFNYWRTASTELVALAPKAPWIGKVGQFETDNAKWATANSETHAYLEYDEVQGAIGPPQRTQFASQPIGAIQEALNAADDMKSIMGLHDASLGARSNETSGVAIMARQREGDVSSFHFIDNLSRSIRHAGRICLDLIPKIYSTSRMVRVLGPDGEAKGVRIGPQPSPLIANSPQGAPQPSQEGDGSEDAAAKLDRIFDLTVGKYDLVVTAGPSFTSRREEAASQMIELIRAYPAAAPIIGDLLAKNLDWPGADEIADRLKAMLPPSLNGENPEITAAHAQLTALAQALGQAKAEIQSLKTDKSIEGEKLKVDQYNAETNRLKAEFGKDGAPYDAAAVAPAVVASLVHILASPDLIEAAQNGAPMEQIISALTQRMGQKPPGDQGGGSAPPAAVAA